MARTPPGATRERVLAFVRGALERGRSPSIRDVQVAVGLRSPEGARQHLLQLVAAGQLEKAAGARGWSLPAHESLHLRFVPLLGQVAAGLPSEALEDRAELVPIDARVARSASARLFALRVRGESMRDAAILSGDIVIVDASARARHRDIVVARIDGDATVKRLWLSRGRVELRPENPAFPTLAIGPDQDAQILGKVIEVRRNLA